MKTQGTVKKDVGIKHMLLVDLHRILYLSKDANVTQTTVTMK